MDKGVVLSRDDENNVPAARVRERKAMATHRDALTDLSNRAGSISTEDTGDNSKKLASKGASHGADKVQSNSGSSTDSGSGSDVYYGRHKAAGRVTAGSQTAISPDASSLVSGKKRPHSDALSDAYLHRKTSDSKRACARGQVVRIPLVSDVPHDDLDADDADDPLLVPEYAEDIYQLWYEQQDRYVVHPSYMHDQPELRWGLRGILMNWLVMVHGKFRLVGETLFLAANLIDRYLDAAPNPTPLGELQLVGVTALFMAAKYEEVYVPSVQNYSYVANFTDSDVRAMERKMLAVLDFDFGYINPLNFLRRISKADDYNVRSRTVAKFLLEISLFDKRLAVYRPSDIAASAMLLARRVLDMDPWNNNFVHYSGGCTSEALQPLVDAMIRFIGGGLIHYPDFHKKYASKKFLKASLLCSAWHAENFSSPSVTSGDEDEATKDSGDSGNSDESTTPKVSGASIDDEDELH